MNKHIMLCYVIRYHYKYHNERSLRDLRSDDRPFGGVTVLFAGDWAQTLPVVVNGDDAQIIAATLLRSSFWHRVRVLRLSINMRLSVGHLPRAEHEETQAFAQWLKEVGSGSANDRDGSIRIRDNSQVFHPDRADGPDRPHAASLRNHKFQGLDGLFRYVYGEDWGRLMATGDDYLIELFSKPAVLAATNLDVNDINDRILSTMPGPTREYKSADSIAGQAEETYRGPPY